MQLTLIECLLLVAAAVLATGCGRTSDSSDAAADAARDPRTTELATEVHDLGWIVFGARTDKGDWDLFVMRPDGSERRNITNTADYNEAAPRFSPDGRKLLYRRLKKDKNIDGNRYGAQGVAALAAATPVDSGLAARSWYYTVGSQNGSYWIDFHNNDIEGGAPVVILIQFGHGTRNGGYVVGRDFINPAIQPIFEQIKSDVWKEVSSV